MKLTINKKEFMDTLKIHKKIVSNKKYVAIIETIKLEAKDNETLLITSTNLEQTLQTTIDCQVNVPGCRAIPFKNLFNVVKLSSGNVTIEGKPDNKAKLGKVTLDCFPFEDFPLMPKISGDTVDLDFKLFQKTLSKSKPFASTDKSKTILTGYYINFENNYILATDSYKAVKTHYDFRITKPMGPIVLPVEVVEVVKEIKADFFHLTRAYKENGIWIKAANHILWSRELTGKYPAPTIENIISKTSNGNANYIIDADKVKTIADKAIKMLQGDKDSLVKTIWSKNQLNLSVDIKEVGSYKDHISIDGDDKESIAHLTYYHLVEVLRLFKNPNVHAPTNVSGPFLFSELSTEAILMPVRVS